MGLNPIMDVAVFQINGGEISNKLPEGKCRFRLVRAEVSQQVWIFVTMSHSVDIGAYGSPERIAHHFNYSIRGRRSAEVGDGSFTVISGIENVPSISVNPGMIGQRFLE